MDGVINLLKPPGMTSHDAVSYLRKLLKVKKVGHTGTLDPGAAGVLPICLGRATRIAEYISNTDKAYRAEITFGITTSTQDGFGEILHEQPVQNLRAEDVERAFAAYTGQINQLPPMYSAVKIHGKRLYELARMGKQVGRPARQVTIFTLKLVKFYEQPPYPKALFDVVCSKGTYIRTLCADLGQWLGYGAYMSYLIRTKAGPFFLNDAITFEELNKALEHGMLDQVLYSIDATLSDLPVVTVKEEAVPKVLHGMSLDQGGILTLPPGLQVGQIVRLHSPAHSLLALAKICSDSNFTSFATHYYKPLKVFN